MIPLIHQARQKPVNSQILCLSYEQMTILTTNFWNLGTFFQKLSSFKLNLKHFHQDKCTSEF